MEISYFARAKCEHFYNFCYVAQQLKIRNWKYAVHLKASDFIIIFQIQY